MAYPTSPYAGTLLVVDDMSANRSLFLRLFSPTYRVLEAKDGSEALEVLKHAPDIDVVLLDLLMPRLDGYEVLRRRMADEALSRIPFIVVTASDERENQRKALALDAYDVVTKPFDPNLIKRRVGNAVAARQAHAPRPQGEPAAVLASRPADQPHVTKHPVLRHAATAFDRSSESFQNIMQNLPAGIVIFDIENDVIPLFISEAARKVLHLSDSDYERYVENCTPMNPPADDKEAAACLERLRQGETIERTFRVSAAGSTWARTVACASIDKQGRLLCYASLVDATERIEEQQRESWQVERYRLLSEASNAVIFDYDPATDTMTVSLNRQGQRQQDVVLSRFLETFGELKYVQSDSVNACWHALVSACEKPGTSTFDFQVDFFDTGFRWYRTRTVSIADDMGHVYRIVGRAEDVDEEIREQLSLTAQAQVDDTTGLLNKLAARKIIEASLATRPHDRVDAMLVIDIDDFKNVNDTCGHLEGDRVLQMVAGQLRHLFRKEDVLVRFGGDEFAVFMRSIGEPALARRKASAIIEAVDNAEVPPGGIPVSCSVGVALANEGNDTFDQLFARADAALYQAKHSGKHRFTMDEPAASEK